MMHEGGDASVLLREVSHRAGNDCAVAIAALRMMRDAHGREPENRARLISDAIARLEASARVHRLLSRPVPTVVEVGAWLSEVCGAVPGTSAVDAGPSVDLDLTEVWLEGTVARRIVMIAAELVTNALKYAGGVTDAIRVSLHSGEGRMILGIADGGPGIEPGVPSVGGGLGSGIVADLVALCGGEIEMRTGAGGTTFVIDMPLTEGGGPRCLTAASRPAYQPDGTPAGSDHEPFLRRT